MFSRNPFTAWHPAGPYTVLIPLERKGGEVLNNTLVLKGSGPLLWERLEVPRSLDELVDAIVGEYEVTAQEARADIIRFVDTLVEWQALDRAPASAG